MSADAVRLFLQRDAMSSNPQYQDCKIEPSFFTLIWKPLVASANQQQALTQIGQDADFLGTKINLIGYDNAGDALSFQPFLMQLRNGSTNTDLTDVETSAITLVGDPGDANFVIEFDYPILLKRTNQLIGKLTNPVATAFEVYATCHGVKLFNAAPVTAKGALS